MIHIISKNTKDIKHYRKLIRLLRLPRTNKINIMEQLEKGNCKELIIETLLKEKDDRIFSCLMFVLGRRNDRSICKDIRRLFKKNISRLQRIESICDTIGMLDEENYCDLLKIALERYPDNPAITATILYAIGMQKCAALKKKVKTYINHPYPQIRRCAREAIRKIR